MFDRGWTDGLPVVPPTEARVLRHARGHDATGRRGGRRVPPDLVECTVEKVAINAVMAGCRPEYLPRRARRGRGGVHRRVQHARRAGHDHAGRTGASSSTADPRAAGMNSGVNVLGQGNRANATIGRALQLVIRNVGGGRPGEVDRATLGNPGKLGFCFAEDEEGSPWEPLSVERGFGPGTSTVTLFAGEGPSVRRRPAVAHARIAGSHPGRLPPDRRTTRSCRSPSTPSWSSGPSTRGCSPRPGGRGPTCGSGSIELLTVPGSETGPGRRGHRRGRARAALADADLPKFRPDGLPPGPRRRRGRAVLDDHRRLGQRRPAAASP